MSLPYKVTVRFDWMRQGEAVEIARFFSQNAAEQFARWRSHANADAEYVVADAETCERLYLIEAREEIAAV